jgi:hypothetical protein
MDKKILLFLDHTNSLYCPDLNSQSIKSPNGYRIIPVESKVNKNNSFWTDSLFNTEIIEPIKQQIQVQNPDSILILSDLKYVDKESRDKKIKLLHESIKKPLAVIDFRRNKDEDKKYMPHSDSEIPIFYTKGTRSLEEDIINLLTYFTQQCQSATERIKKALKTSDDELLKITEILNTLAENVQKIKVIKKTKITNNKSVIYKFELAYDDKTYTIYFDPMKQEVSCEDHKDIKVQLNNDLVYKGLLDYFIKLTKEDFKN